MVVISFYLRLLNRSNKFDNNAPSDEALRVMICIASPRSSRNTFSISTSLSPSFHSLRYSYRENCSEGDIHLALPAPQLHGFNGIIAFFCRNCKGFRCTDEIKYASLREICRGHFCLIFRHVSLLDKITRIIYNKSHSSQLKRKKFHLFTSFVSGVENKTP